MMEKFGFCGSEKVRIVPLQHFLHEEEIYFIINTFSGTLIALFRSLNSIYKETYQLFLT
jgi:hypothetical protein